MSAYPAVGAYDRRAAPSGSGPAAMYPRVAHPVPSASPFSGAGGTSLRVPVVTAVGAGAHSGGLGGVGGMGGHGPSGGAPGLAAGPAPIAVTIKTQLRVAQPPPLAPVQAVPVSAAAFDFDVEKQLLSEASALHQRTSVAVKREVDPRASKYIQMGMDREAVIMALAMHGDSHSQVVDFCNAYTLLREMGFDPVAVAGCLALCGNDRDRALQLLSAKIAGRRLGDPRSTTEQHAGLGDPARRNALPPPPTTRHPLTAAPAGVLPIPLALPGHLTFPPSAVFAHLPAFRSICAPPRTFRLLVPRQDAVRCPAPATRATSPHLLPPRPARCSSGAWERKLPVARSLRAPPRATPPCALPPLVSPADEVTLSSRVCLRALASVRRIPPASPLVPPPLQPSPC
ncbi:unnamed protein product [Closterium sp. Yama58-4]|nr:unnamed protein product [Closterium sp. Yama58-4]